MNDLTDKYNQLIDYLKSKGDDWDMLDKKDLDILQEVLNEEILSYLDSGYKLDDEYTIDLRNLLRKLNLEEVYDFDKRYSKGE